jgi:CO/xanthine dehydrogenase Mo-binding subunit
MTRPAQTTPTALPGFLISEQFAGPVTEPARTMDTAPVDEGLGDSGRNPALAPAPPQGDGIGRRVPAAKVGGRYPFVADISVPGMLWASMRRSPYPNARLVTVDTTEAARISGVYAVLAGADLGVAEVDYAGQCVAVAAASHPALARAALAATRIEYEPGPALTDPRRAFGAPGIHPEGNVAAYRHIVFPRPVAAGDRAGRGGPGGGRPGGGAPGGAGRAGAPGIRVGGIGAGPARPQRPGPGGAPGGPGGHPGPVGYGVPGVPSFSMGGAVNASATGIPGVTSLVTAPPAGPGAEDLVTVVERYEFARPFGALGGPDTVLAVPEGEFVYLHTVTVDPERDRRAVALALGRPETSIRLIPAPFTGTSRGDDPDLRVAAALLAVRTGRPVKAVDEVRPVAAQPDGGPAAPPQPAIRVHATHTADRDGTLREVRIEIVVDAGAESDAAVALLDEYCRLAVGPYRAAKVDIQGWVVRTHNPPLTDQAHAAPALAAVVAETQLDTLAAALGKSGLEVRVKNLIKAGDQLPDGRRLAAPAVLPELLTAILDASVPPFPPGPDVREFPGGVGRTGELTRLRRGVGVAFAMADLLPPDLPEERAGAQVALTADEHGPLARVVTTLVDTGSGEHALLRRVVRDALGVRRVLVRRPLDPAAVPTSPIGAGRAIWLHGTAVQRAARAVRSQVLASVAAELAVSPDLLEVRGDQVVTYDGVLSRPLEQVYAKALRGGAQYVADGDFRVRTGGSPEPGVFVPEPGQAYLAIAVHRAVVDADTELGLLRPIRATAAHDAGRVLVEGRARAAVRTSVVAATADAMRLAGLTPQAPAESLAEAQLPTMLDLPEVEVLAPLESSIGDLATTALRRRGFSAPLPLGYKPIGRVAHAAALAALTCAARDARHAEAG